MQSVVSCKSPEVPTDIGKVDIAEYLLALVSEKKGAKLSSVTIEPISKCIKEIIEEFKDYVDLI